MVVVFFFLLFNYSNLFGQGFNHVWLHGSELTFDTNTTAPKARLFFDGVGVDTLGEVRKMAFNATQATICDANGNFLFASNGCWIMDATGDTMQNGNKLNPGTWFNSCCSTTSGMIMPSGNLIIPYPGDSNRFVLFHHTASASLPIPVASEIFYTVIDMTKNSGLGAVDSNQKNVIAFSDTLSWGLAACKHSNGRDWWIVAVKDSSNTIFKILFTPNGVASVTSQSVNMPSPTYGNVAEPCFSPDGTKFAWKNGLTQFGAFHDVRILSFDRCTGNFDSLGYATRYNEFGFGLSFSPNSQFLYYSSGVRIYQLDTDSPNISNTDSVVAVYDGYCYPYSFTCTRFFTMYLAANGKIYLTSRNYVIDLHYINYPDSAGVTCDVVQHGLRMPCYTIDGGINHPNYYLGCDTTSGCPCYTGVQDISQHDFRFRIYPNPTKNNQLSIGYLLPQNKSGTFQIFDVTGKLVFNYNLPPWSNEQSFTLPELSGGVYQCVVKSDEYFAIKKLAVIK
ncbi:MAG: T9SS type A sorting domain-containing protein [Bacteroidetes bacterium]|nr:T9SS type A sorting domain-containing protein [Bacteroidota bacterium]